MGLGKIQLSRRGVAEFKPQLRHPRIAAHQIAIRGQSGIVTPGEQLLLRLLPAAHVAGIALELHPVVIHGKNEM